ncbi:glucosidase [Planctomycetota bacterium]|nr:glucosidase [Planctomycetota bacterium]
MDNAESRRLAEDAMRLKNWKRWGPYLSERQWGTVREDYSVDGDVWSYFTHDAARSRAYRWGEDGLLGLTDRECRLCFALSLWNEKDVILKERLFGLSGSEGNHGEDVKEVYYYLDSLPTHAYAKALYKYPQQAFPYDDLVEENSKRDKDKLEYELCDTGVFNDDRYFDVFVEYAKKSPDDILIRITVKNLGPDTAILHILPTIWFRNTWIWGCTHEGCGLKPQITLESKSKVKLEHETLGTFYFEFSDDNHNLKPDILFTENETNTQRLFNVVNKGKFVKDAFHDWLIENNSHAINPEKKGTKAAGYYRQKIDSQEETVINLRLYSGEETPKQTFGDSFDSIMQKRSNECDEFYDDLIADKLCDDEKLITRQAYAGLLWSKQFYHYVVQDWLKGDPAMPGPPADRSKNARNKDWPHVFSRDILSMPDKWEYPWFAAWDLAFHMIPFSKLDADFAKYQLEVMLREWYMHPNGQIPAYEFSFDDVNPPVHAWACWRVYKLTGEKGKRDYAFLARTFQKLLMNFTWWVNRKDPHGDNLFSGGFLGLDNIGVFDRSQPLPHGERMNQADGTAWMGFYAAVMLGMGLELANKDNVYEDLASKFFEHFVAIIDAMNTFSGTGLWDEKDGFYYDQLLIDRKITPLRVRSLVGLIPLFAVLVIDESIVSKAAGFNKRMKWFVDNRPELSRHITKRRCTKTGITRYLLAIPPRDRLESILRYMLDTNEFLSPYGIRSLSKIHKSKPFQVELNGNIYRVDYEPGESKTVMFGGNSNWRGPIWLPINYLIIEALQRYQHFYGDEFTIECPTGSGVYMTLGQVALDIQRRLASLFSLSEDKTRPCHGYDSSCIKTISFEQNVLFYEYFHGDTGRGLGASHQTGWTALIAKVLDAMAHEKH